MSDPVTVRVLTMDADMDFEIQPSVTGTQLLDQVASTIGLKEVWYFGLAYVNKHGAKWLAFNKKVLSQVRVEGSAPRTLRLWVRFHPENVDEVIQEVTLRLLYLQTRDAVLSSTLWCPAETSVLLASYAAQVTHGDLSDTTVYQKDEEFLPERVLQQFSLSREQWEEKIMSWHAEHAGTSRREAMREYLAVAQDLESYGVSFFPISNSRGSDLCLGVSAQGLSVYVGQDLLTPKIDFIWDEIEVLSTDATRFIITSGDKDSPDFEFTVPSVRTNRCLLFQCKGNHELSLWRDGDSPPQLTQLRREEGWSRVPSRAPQSSPANAAQQQQQLMSELRGRVQEESNGLSRRSSSSSSSEASDVPEEVKRVEVTKVEKETKGETRNSQLKAVAASLASHDGDPTLAPDPQGPVPGRATRFLTLRRIRRGTTQQRIDEYEAL